MKKRNFFAAKKTLLASCLIILTGVFLANGEVFSDEPSWGTQQSDADDNGGAKQAMDEALDQTWQRTEPLTKKDEQTLAGKVTSPSPAEEAKKQPVEDLFIIADNVYWDVSDKTAVLEIRAEEKVFLKGEVRTDQGGRVARWIPSKPLVVRSKKENPVGSPFLKKVSFLEASVLTKKFGLEAPYYVLAEITLTFSEPVYYEASQEENWVAINFMPREDKEEEKKEEEALRKAAQQNDIGNLVKVPTTAADLLGDFFQAKEQYEVFLIGGARISELARKMRSERTTSQMIFDGLEGYPEDISPVFRQEYPAFGTAEFWKKHIRAALRQTVGFSSDFDGIYGAGGSQTKQDKAFAWHPDVNVAFQRFGYERTAGAGLRALRANVSYNARRLFPMGSRLKFGDGQRFQTIDIGADYYPQKRLAFSLKNNITLFGGKTLTYETNEKGQDNWIRDARHGHRMINAVGISYKLSRLSTLRAGVGFESTRSDADNGRSRDQSVYFNASIDTQLSKRAVFELGYGYRHILKDTDPSVTPANITNVPIRDTEAKDLHMLTGHLRYRITEKLFVEGGPEFGTIDSEIYKFGGRFMLLYQPWLKSHLQLNYFNGLIQDNSNKIIGGPSSRVTISTGRLERAGISYWYTMGASTLAKSKLGVAFNYLRKTALSEIYTYGNDQPDFEDWINFETTWVRKLRGGLMWLELTYRYSQYRDKTCSNAQLLHEGTNFSQHEHAVFLTITNYFGEWEEMT